ncbi:hypothetical protein B0T22DRAFT_486358 [Podospora appendiculata]|uniref:EF-hand domain-containing protein n=1 Tax=Podospora appendiculata TaxID=314037 RepID=A0AAE0XFH9_9PEZI|nr:hypothetical protein B0T22DRAFT_486358 [Podospora appendiculata]
MAANNGYKPSPLGYGSPRGSPFRRPESPVSPSPIRQTTPSAAMPSKANLSNGAPRFVTSPGASSNSGSWTPRGNTGSDDAPTPLPHGGSRSPVPRAMAQGNAVSQLQPAQVRTLREGFQILDRDSDGIVNRDDVADMLHQLGLPSNSSDVSPFFPPSASQTMTLALYLNSLSTSLAALSPSSELLSAFSAFDDDDSGQIDLAELRDALLHTAPEPGEKPLTALEVDKVMNGFTSRRAFSKSKTNALGKRGDVFRYQDFVNSVVGGKGNPDQASEDAENA